MDGHIPVESALKVSQFKKVFNPCIHVFVKCVRVLSPVTKKMADIQIAGVTVRVDDICCPGLLIEGLVSYFVQMIGILPTPPDARVGAVEEEAHKTIRGSAGKSLSHMGFPNRVP